MTRSFGSTLIGFGFSHHTVDLVWSKGRPIPGYDANVWRQDVCGAPMKYGSYGTTGEFGWEVDHIVPVSAGGSDDLSNLQPLLWRNNRHKSDSYPKWSCASGT
ncbi:MAG: HNH endonuclease signature motif containing protein [Deltaproteobacteria bacterium]